MKTAEINGIITYAPTSKDEIIDYAFINKSILIAVNAEKILHATDSSRTLFNRNLAYPDGIGAVFALKKKGLTHAMKIAGCELWLDIIEKHYTSKSFYLIGGKEKVIKNTVQKLKSNFKGINIINYRDGYIKSKEEERELIKDIVKHKPHVVFVAMGSPKQEILMEKLQQKHSAVYQGLGGSFDVYTNEVKRAPSWWIKNNLEWAYRLKNQPSRIFRQLHLLKFFVFLNLNKY